MSLKDLLKTFTSQEKELAQEAIDDHTQNTPPHKPSGWYGLPEEKAWKLDAELKPIAPTTQAIQ